MAGRRSAAWKGLAGAPTSHTGRRAGALEVLHRRQIALLQDWRRQVADQRPDASEATLIDLLQTVNAIAGGLRTTG